MMSLGELTERGWRISGYTIDSDRERIVARNIYTDEEIVLKDTL